MAFVKKPQMTSAEFTTAMREAGFGVDAGRIVDISGQCPGFSTSWSRRRRQDGHLGQSRRLSTTDH
jgi:hypothetical protein